MCPRRGVIVCILIYLCLLPCDLSPSNYCFNPPLGNKYIVVLKCLHEDMQKIAFYAKRELYMGVCASELWTTRFNFLRYCII